MKNETLHCLPIAKKHMTAVAQAKAGDPLDGSAIDAVVSWADELRHDHRETGPWRYIDVPLADSKIDLAHECPNGDCAIAKTEQFLAFLLHRQSSSPKGSTVIVSAALAHLQEFLPESVICHCSGRLGKDILIASSCDVRAKPG